MTTRVTMTASAARAADPKTGLDPSAEGREPRAGAEPADGRPATSSVRRAKLAARANVAFAAGASWGPT